MGRLILVGAGPGDPELLTLKAKKAIQNADVILYDALVDKTILDFAKVECTRIFVGKRGYQKSVAQEMINALCVEHAKINERVVRLKGGDPFIFGRGHEEIEYARSHNIETEVIPGLSSATSLATLAGIPLTIRGISRGFSVVSAVDKNGKLTDELTNSVKNKMTLVILMGLKQLSEICRLYIKNGRAEDGVMIIASGSLPNQKTVVGTIATIETKMKAAKIAPPGIIIVGEVVKITQLTEEVNG